MGWFWADGAPASSTQTVSIRTASAPRYADNNTTSPPRSCPMHQKSANALSPHPTPSSPPSACPVPHSRREATDPHGASEGSASLLSQLNPLNRMPRHISQAPAPNQKYHLPITREESTIPRGAAGEDGNWEYPSPQQMYNALLRKGYADTDITAVEEMVAVHNFLNEGAWAEIVGWEQRFGGGLMKGAQICGRGEENSEEMIQRARQGNEVDPKLVRFQGRPGDMSPRAFMLQVLGKIYPSKFDNEPPFDRHDWYVSRTTNGQSKEVRYVIDYYSGPPEPTGEPVFYLDVRPAATLTGAAERLIRWGGDMWWRASGGIVREQKREQQK